MPAENPQKTLGKKKAVDFEFKSRLDKPIRELSNLQQSLLFAEISLISYLDVAECNVAAGKLGFKDGKFFSVGGSQAYWFQNDHDSVIVFRGTETDDWNDIQADANALTAIAETVGKVHRGFKYEADEIWPVIEKALESNDKELWFCGHSLGGAMATICSGRCVLSYLKMEPEAVFTYGSPRVGCRRYVNYIQLDHFRWVNNNDIVARVPPALLGYRHCGTEMYLDHRGRLRKMSYWERFWDGVKGFWSSLWKREIDHLADHSIVDYIDALYKLVRQERDAAAGR